MFARKDRHSRSARHDARVEHDADDRRKHSSEKDLRAVYAAERRLLAAQSLRPCRGSRGGTAFLIAAGGAGVQ